MNKSAEKKSHEQRGNAREVDFDALCDAFLYLRTRDECRRFLIDLCTPAELEAFEERWKIAKMLDKGKLSYRDIHKISGASLTTIGRVARFLTQESYGGYKLILQRLKNRK